LALVLGWVQAMADQNIYFWMEAFKLVISVVGLPRYGYDHQTICNFNETLFIDWL
jgi:N6-adenosine-specific RNA methylase IME4